MLFMLRWLQRKRTHTPRGITPRASNKTQAGIQGVLRMTRQAAIYQAHIHGCAWHGMEEVLTHPSIWACICCSCCTDCNR